MSRFKSLVAMLLALSMLLGAGAMPAMAEETRDDIVIALWSEPSTLAAVWPRRPRSTMVSRQIFDTLISKNAETGEYEPCLATEWTWENDNTDLVLTLRDDVTFHNGEPMTAEDVAFSYNTIINAGYADTRHFCDGQHGGRGRHARRAALPVRVRPGARVRLVGLHGHLPQAAYEAAADFGREPSAPARTSSSSGRPATASC